MDRINKYAALLNANRIKKDFICELIEVLRVKNENDPKIKKVGSMLFTVGFSDIQETWSTHDLLKQNGLSDAAKALVSKCIHMIDSYGFSETVRFLFCLRNGTKRISMQKDTYADPIQEQIWKTHKDGQEYLAHEKNLQRAHFRWNYGQRYILSDLEVKSISGFIDTFVGLNEEKDINRKEIWELYNLIK